MTGGAAEHDRGPRRAGPWLAAALVAGVGLRVLIVVAAPRWGYVFDHLEVLCMGAVAGERGLARAYSATPDELPTLHSRMVQDGRLGTFDRRCIYPPNYPPIAITVFWAQSRWLGVDDPAFVANTPYTRLVTSAVPWAFELLAAVGVGLLARAVTGRAASGMAAGVVAWLAPPFMLNTGLFGQYDALAVAPAVFAVLAMVRGRWLAAGVALGVTLLAKPQGLLMLPVAAFAALVAAPSGAAAVTRRLLVLGTATALTIAVGTAPWTLADGLAWVQRCYRMNLFEVLSYTTLEAYNVWYLAALLGERQPVYDVLASTATVVGMSRDAWGRVLLAAALAGVASLVWLRHRRHPATAIVLLAGLWLWSVFMWPTRVHERYLLYCLPFMLVAAVRIPRLRPAVAILLVVATMEHTWIVWRPDPGVGTFAKATVDKLHLERFDAYWQGRPVSIEAAKAGPKPEESRQLAFERYRDQRRRTLWLEWLLTMLSLAAYARALVVAWTPPPMTDPEAP